VAQETLYDVVVASSVLAMQLFDTVVLVILLGQEQSLVLVCLSQQVQVSGQLLCLMVLLVVNESFRSIVVVSICQLLVLQYLVVLASQVSS